MDYTHFETEMTRLTSEISKLLTVVLRSFENSIKALEDKNLELAEKVLKADDQIDDLNRQIEESVYQIVARFRPLAKDLRYAVTMIKFANNLERIGDLSCNIAEKTKIYAHIDLKDIVNTKEIKKMFGISLEMIKDSYKAFGERNIEEAVKIWKRDDEVDNLEKQIRKIAVQKLEDESFNKELIIPYILLTRDIERIADHATNLCEEIVYIETGKEIEDYL
ncbi:MULTISPECIES: phosphate signaling complex protein PhoU [Petrotoga]|uniref:Phosphate-specific transport system accessory protein PhoU n=2 Tax=Petrotoga sibirica TaxID=156202 RepID=A0A4R8EKY3_9BACT|nr:MULTISPECIES: phosphate signaling complex protein PhoU [Petrotoga]KUK81695.1 MAG: Phosphate-specific transport system accessory protein PhoU [Petrotoga mobilis]POZ87796.1 PhoU family transcriptional regulator [Petrotoga sibirica DSM 13575]POZ89836.1 PhoU family transcriptional regulator [Petrotoga sp. SL27]TDX11105.1 PhoU-like phosphate uptake regulator [Petrotoga sibirica]